jgi:HD-GYP domain-containing protein (c-di-GMP phosphodiesterase class II)
MHTINEISIYDFVCAISEAVDFISPALNNHHKKVAYLSYRIASNANLPKGEIQNIILAAMLHDIGSFSVEERIKSLASMFYDDDEEDHHDLLGYKLLKGFEPLAKVATLIKYHHSNYNKLMQYIPLGSYIIRLADRISVLLDDRREILEQVTDLLKILNKVQEVFHPDLFGIFQDLAKMEYFWLEAFSPALGSVILEKVKFPRMIIDLETLRSFAKLTAQIIDFRSRFTSTHSSGVAAVARELTSIYGYPEKDCKAMEIAGFMHDVGKLAVSNHILEKNGRLSSREYNSIRKHTYYTYFVLNRIRGLEHIAAYAAHHHEREDGNGYPFHVKGKEFSQQARIMAVADVMTALTEDRPYRLGMNREKSTELLHIMANNGAIDKGVVNLLDKNFFRINDVRIQAQLLSRKEYEEFNDTEV